MYLLGASGGDAVANGFSVSSSATTVIGFSLTGSVVPAGSGVLVDLLVDDPSALCLTDLVISGVNGAYLEAYVDGCNTIVYSWVVLMMIQMVYVMMRMIV